ncbi:hypothetical protein [Rhodococcus sp. ARC_M6]|uniref:hypothetical protein n=1 Tax=Rhodococcus sp. ARC_M6 TaxID=2928852 RepID=UPI001FB28433|nr:hypothetical protein [Rhodococcus sp. ARC_M6]MCJ0906129.1 hypothetical protein [Rhodococcus sp. ARC_M6]
MRGRRTDAVGGRTIKCDGAVDATALGDCSFSMNDSTDGTQARSTKMPANIVHDTLLTSARSTATVEYF